MLIPVIFAATAIAVWFSIRNELPAIAAPFVASVFAVGTIGLQFIIVMKLMLS
ncbi:hypothetical protein DSM25558_5115 [Agrobacterium sp. DSM 25558]|uniref:hypothetical protein n=1 Tax=Agrobacterium sp. DSM 25558 TaxID=1907665 RepID=UPI00097260C5|nr:hypothetical protein [Agrobacterium sp. DSM 25558]SCX31085.1 hypothetical protein DSM25558_5115 [Agrobacterium sp. DSM 25558]